MLRTCVDCGGGFEPARAYHRQCWRCWRGDQEPRRRTPPALVQVVPLLDSQTIKAAVSLVHPDRHPPERHAMALRVTQELTAALERTRRLERTA